jgi:hypothetical protein
MIDPVVDEMVAGDLSSKGTLCRGRAVLSTDVNAFLKDSLYERQVQHAGYN